MSLASSCQLDRDLRASILLHVQYCYGQILAGFETSSTSVTLTLEALCDDTTVQDKLRKEVLAVETDNPS